MPESYQMLNSSLYVDDLFHGADTLEDAYRLSCDAINILKDAGMNLRKLQSNSRKLKTLWLKNNFSENENHLNDSKILGMIWNSQSDILTLDINRFPYQFF